jgi:RND family efflux transporter MFP subunit
MRRVPRPLLAALLLLAAAAGAWAWRARPPSVETARATTGPAVEAVYATGTVEPVHWARVGPALRGRVVEVLVEEGQPVRRGQPLARLEDSAARHQAEEAEARSHFAADHLARTRLLVARDIAARVQLERAESDARAARALADAAARRLDDYVVRAPADGVVLRRDAEPGQIADPLDALFWVGEPRPLRVSAEVDEEDIARVAAGQEALLRADAFPGRVLAARVAQITPKGDTARKAYRVRLSLLEDTPLHVGMTVEANIVLRRTPDAVLVRAGAVREGGHVWVVDAAGRVSRRAVRTGVQGPRAVEIQEGLAAGEAVVLDPPAGLREGRAVRPRRGTGPAAAAAGA